MLFPWFVFLGYQVLHFIGYCVNQFLGYCAILFLGFAVSGSLAAPKKTGSLHRPSRGATVEISEDVVGLGKYNKTLTVLYDIDIPEADEEEDEQSPIESWTPRFKR